MDQDQERLIELALELAERGIPVFPCAANKAPVIPKEKGGNGFLDASLDIDVIERLFSWPGAKLIGVPTGQFSGFDVLDIDPRHNGHLWEADHRGKMPETRIHKTLHGGHHWVFLHAPGVGSSQHKIAPGVDVRGDGGYACWPPSEGYKIVSDAEAVHWPDWLLELALAASATRQRLSDSHSRGNGNGHAMPSEGLSDRRLNGYVRSLLTNVHNATDGQKHYILRNAALALGGIQNQAGFSEQDAKRWLLDVLPPSVKNWKGAEATILWGLRTGRLAEIELPNRKPPPRAPWQDRRDRARQEQEERRDPDAPKTFDQAWDNWRPIEQIPPRPWLLGNLLMCGASTMIASPGGAGKTALSFAMILAVITGRDDILEEHVFQNGPVWVLFLEDKREEFERRLRGAMKEHNVSPDDIKGKLFVRIGFERKTMVARTAEDGSFEFCADAGDLEDHIEHYGAVLTVIDTIKKSHQINENDNGHMDQLVELFNLVADRTNSAFLLLHHFRKGSKGNIETGRDAIRGAGSLVDTLRIVRTLVVMTDKEAEFFGIPEKDTRYYLRLDDVKSNMAPKSDAFWIELRSVALGNTRVDPRYPKGDYVQVAVRWTPGPVTDGMSREMVLAIFDQLRRGASEGVPYTPSRNGGGSSKRWAGNVIMDLAGRTADQAHRLLEAWRKNEVWRPGEYLNQKNQPRQCLVLNEVKIADLLRAYRSTPQSDAQ